MLGETTKTLAKLALQEDLGTPEGIDLTSAATLHKDSQLVARIISRQPLVVCGHEVAQHVFQLVDPEVRYDVLASDGTAVPESETLALITGNARAILAGERTALNFMQRLSGISSKTRRIVERVRGSGVAVLDTRKTAPGFRELDKYAVLTGGGSNHRFGLYDAVLIKNNHIDALGGDIAQAIRNCRDFAPPGTKIQCEVRTLEELAGALDAAPDAILLDNMSPDQLQRAVTLARAHPCGKTLELEASGGITIENIELYAAAGVDSISLGELTHSVQAADLSLRYQT